MTVKQYRKKPVVIDAVQWDGTVSHAATVIDEFTESMSLLVEDKDGNLMLEIETLEEKDGSVHYASPSDWIIKGIKGEFYACKPDIFEQTYEEA